MGRPEGTTPTPWCSPGLTEQNGAELIKDKVAVLGAEQRHGQAARSRRVRAAGDDRRHRAGRGGDVRQRAGTGSRQPHRPRQDLVDQLTEQAGGEPVELFAPYAGQAAR